MKRFDLIPKIASALKHNGIEFKWILVGPADNLNELNKLQESIAANDVSDCVYWIGQRVNPYSYLSQANLLVSTSETEACPMIFIESKILNVPIITSNMLTAEEFVINGTDGFVVPINQMSEAIMRLIDQPALYESLKQNSDNRIHNDISLATFRGIVQ